ncbi:RNA polymerase sigma factor [Flavobacterium soyangense]|uniref:RNA polymerase sigma factor n=1 Tax=Flavobacterium soyangense TaxID=2023265 RepID=A0A930XTN4_9FLAO|nr:RNA polymerase sigma factor [Flavobacterium soyangense]MBF2707670.1 RNA polymerase sigma factor [Flavobacterium soyangense]
MIATTTYSKRQVIPAFFINNAKLVDPKNDSALLVKLVQSKSERGFHTLYNKYCGALYGVIIKLVKRTDVADDLLQDTFVKIWKNIDTFDSSKGTIYTWMLNIARNHAVDYLRSSTYRKQLLQVEIDLFSHCTDSIGNTVSNSCPIEFKDFKNKALQLDPKYTEVIDLIYFYGWTQEQTAEILKLPLGTIKTRARKGLSLLKMLYQQ